MAFGASKALRLPADTKEAPGRNEKERID